MENTEKKYLCALIFFSVFSVAEVFFNLQNVTHVLEMI